LVMRTLYKDKLSNRHDDLSSSHQSSNVSLWARLGSGANLTRHVEDNIRIDKQMEWLVKNRDFLNRASDRASPYLYFIVQSLEQRGLPRELALLPMIESGYNPTAVSVRNAVGLWQFMPATATSFGLRRTAGYDGRRDVLASTSAALDYLERLHKQFEGDWLLALAAYNAGEGTVGRALDANRRQGLPTDYWHLRLPRETAEYVPRLLAFLAAVHTPDAYGLKLSPVLDQPYFVQVKLPHSVDLEELAVTSEIPELTLRQLNPAYMQGTTQEGPGHILVPVAMRHLLIAMFRSSSYQSAESLVSRQSNPEVPEETIVEASH
jgi:membrane-bound lytic murein transglycosylase D